MFLDKGANCNKYDAYDMPPLLNASEYCHTETVEEKGGVDCIM